jgi:hypothetical protein
VRYYESEKEKNRFHIHGGWWDIEKGLLPIFWEKELTDGRPEHREVLGQV